MKVNVLRSKYKSENFLILKTFQKLNIIQDFVLESPARLTRQILWSLYVFLQQGDPTIYYFMTSLVNVSEQQQQQQKDQKLQMYEYIEV